MRVDVLMRVVRLDAQNSWWVSENYWRLTVKMRGSSQNVENDAAEVSFAARREEEG